jgi:hypothetical protein
MDNRVIIVQLGSRPIMMLTRATIVTQGSTLVLKEVHLVRIATMGSIRRVPVKAVVLKLQQGTTSLMIALLMVVSRYVMQGRTPLRELLLV